MPCLQALGLQKYELMRARVQAETLKTMFFAGLLLLGLYLALRGGLHLWHG